MTTMTCSVPTENERVRDVGNFLAEYAAYLLGCGAACIRVEKNVRRMAVAFNVLCEVVILPSHIQVAVRNASGDVNYQVTEHIRHTGISFWLNTELSKLSWQVAEGKRDLAGAMNRFRLLIKGSPTNRWAVLLLASAANASFCRLFGGDAVSMLIVFMATLAGFFLKQVMQADKVDIRLTTLASAFFASVIGASGYVFHWGDTPEVALGTSVLYLIPGIPYINSMSDLLDGHYVSFLGRVMQAIVLTVCISLGLCGGLLLMNLKWFN